MENFTKTYKKCDSDTYDIINNEAKKFAKSFHVNDRAECMVPSNTFITLKDHKDNFDKNPKCRLMNPAKSGMGRISKTFIKSANRIIREKSGLLQWCD